MGTTLITRSIMAVLALVLIPTLIALAGEQAPGTGIPEVMQAPAPAQQDPPEANDESRQGAWVQEITSSVNMYQSTYPTSNFTPYLEKLTVVRDAVRNGDRPMVKGQMTAFFTILAKRSHGINEGAAEELFNFSCMVTPIQEYGIGVPRTAAETHGTMLIP